MRMRKLGALEVSELGFGTLSFASTYGQAPEKAESIRVIRGAHDLGVTLFDTAEVYGPWTNEALVGEALAPVRNEVVIAGATAAQVALAWLLARGPSIVPIFGTRRLDRVKENLGAAEVSLSDEDMAAIEARLAGIEVTGERLPPALLKVTYR